MIERLRRNDRKAYSDLFDGYFDKLFTFALNMVFREDVANDIVQEVFIAIYEKSILKNYQGSLKAYLYTSVRTVSYTHLKSMTEKILEQGGALISEFPTCAPILPTNFLQRNRIVAGMSEAILVAESPIKGGAMSTARQALSYNRDVMAIPGRPEDPTFTGCNLLIKQNIAALVENIKDLLQILNWPPLPTGPYQMSLDLFPVTDKEVLLMETLAKMGEQNIDQLHQLTRIPVHDLSVLLLKLELEGRTMQLPGNCYTLI